MIGKAGQQLRYFLTGVPYVQRSWMWRRSGDANMICRHRWHTCTSLSHLHGGNWDSKMILWKSNISSKMSSGSMSIVPQLSPKPYKLILVAVATCVFEDVP